MRFYRGLVSGLRRQKLSGTASHLYALPDDAAGSARGDRSLFGKGRFPDSYEWNPAFRGGDQAEVCDKASSDPPWYCKEDVSADLWERGDGGFSDLKELDGVWMAGREAISE